VDEDLPSLGDLHDVGSDV